MIVPYTDKGKMVELESGLIVPGHAVPKPLPKAFDFFAGAGGFSCGLHQGGFHVVGAMELDQGAAQVYLMNLGSYGKLKIHFDTADREKKFTQFLDKQIEKNLKKTGIASLSAAGSGWISEVGGPGCEHFWIADIRNMTGEMILKELGMERGELDLVVGGPPCQGFSNAGKRELDDPRNNLVFEYARLIVELNPKTFVMENVEGITTMTTVDGTPILDEFCRIIADGSYAPYESARRMLGLNPKAKRVVRANVDKSQMAKRAREPRKPLASAAVVSPQPNAQASLF